MKTMHELAHSHPQLAACARVGGGVSFFWCITRGGHRCAWCFARLLQWVLVHIMLFFPFVCIVTKHFSKGMQQCIEAVLPKQAHMFLKSSILIHVAV